MLQLNDIRRYKDILLYRTIAQLKAESKNMYLGYVWFVLEPVLSTAILYVVFSVLRGKGDSEMVLFIFIGMMAWQWFEGSISMGMQGIRSKLHIHNTMHIPKFLFPLVDVLANTWKYLWLLIVLVVLVNILGFFVNVHYFYLPIVLLVQMVVIIGLTIPLAIACTYMMDFATVVSSVMRLLFFVSGIFFPISTVPEELLFYFKLNPMARLMNAQRDIFLYDRAPNFMDLGYCLAFGVACLALGILMNRAIDRKLVKSVSA